MSPYNPKSAKHFPESRILSQCHTFDNTAPTMYRKHIVIIASCNVRQGWGINSLISEWNLPYCPCSLSISTEPSHLGGKGTIGEGPWSNEMLPGHHPKDESNQQSWERGKAVQQDPGRGFRHEVHLEVCGSGKKWKEKGLRTLQWGLKQPPLNTLCNIVMYIIPVQIKN